MTETSPRISRREDRPAGWRSRLAVFTAGILIFLTLGGLAIWLTPFSVFNQINVLLHTLIGLLALAPVGWYSVRHWLFYRRHPLTHVKLLGYSGVIALLVCAITGLALTRQPLFGVRISHLWRSLHDWATVALIVLVAAHCADRDPRRAGEAYRGRRACLDGDQRLCPQDVDGRGLRDGGDGARLLRLPASVSDAGFPARL